MKALRKTGPITGLATILFMGGFGWTNEGVPAQTPTTVPAETKQEVAGQKPVVMQPTRLSASEKAAKEAMEAERAERKKKVDAEIALLDDAADSARSKMLQDFERRKRENEQRRSPAPRETRKAK